MSVFSKNRHYLAIVLAYSLLVCACHSVPRPLAEGGQGPAQGRLVHAEDSAVGRVLVVDEGHLRYLRFDDPDGDDQSVVSLAHPQQVPMAYVRLATVGLAHLSHTRKVLMVGLGAGSFTSLLWRVLPRVDLEVAEISPVVYRIARKYFKLPQDQRYRVYLEDGRAYLERTTKRYDLILLDAYNADDVPPSLAELSFFRLVKDRLTKGGLAMINLAVDEEREEAILNSFRQAFEEVICYSTADGENLLVLGARPGVLLSDAQAQDRAKQLDEQLDLPFSLAAEASRMVDCQPDAKQSP